MHLAYHRVFAQAQTLSAFGAGTKLARVPIRHIFAARNRSTTVLSPRARVRMKGFRARPLNCLLAHRRVHIMDPLTSAAASGMRARMQSLDMLANNIANTSAPGFKADREFYGLYTSADAADSSSAPQSLPVIERQWTDFSQGALTPTSNPLDLGLSGKGFFVATSPSGPVYTRAGSFELSSQGQLQTPEGYAIQNQDGNPIVLDSSKPVEIVPDGTIRQDGQDVSRIRVVDFKDSSALSKRGNSYFETSASLRPAPSDAEVQQGRLESANSQPAESAVRLVGILRQYETLQKAMTIGADMNRRVVEEVAKATS